MSAIGSLEALVNGMPDDIKTQMLAYTREWATSLRFGAPSTGAVATENFGGALVPFVTSAVSNGEVAVAHNLGRVPRMLMPVLPLNTVNATMPVITVTKAADATYFYIKSATQSASMWSYVE